MHCIHVITKASTSLKQFKPLGQLWGFAWPWFTNTHNVPLLWGFTACDSRWNILNAARRISDLRVL